MMPESSHDARGYDRRPVGTAPTPDANDERTTPAEGRTYDARDNAGPWAHDDGTPCPHYHATRATGPNGVPWWCTEHQQHVHTATPATEPTSTGEGGLREAVEALAEECSNSAGRPMSWWRVGARLEALLAAHPEPVPTPDSADDTGAGEREHVYVSTSRDHHFCDRCLLAEDDERANHIPATPDADATTPVEGGEVEARIVDHPTPGTVWVQIPHHNDLGGDWIAADFTDWLKAHDAARDADLRAERDRLRTVVARVEALAEDLCDFHGGHGDYLSAGKSLRAALASTDRHDGVRGGGT